MQGFHWPSVGFQAQGMLRGKHSGQPFNLREQHWPTHAERVKNQCPRESPSGELQSVSPVGRSHHDDPSLRAVDKAGGSLRCDRAFLDKHMAEHAFVFGQTHS